jgi:hypothetical protein
MASTIPPTLSGEPPEKPWHLRNWKWLAPLVYLIIVALIFSIYLYVHALFRGFHFVGSDAYGTTLATACTNSLLLTAIGAPIGPGLLVTGDLNTNGPVINADLYIPVTGSHGRATIHTVGSFYNGMWRYTTMTAVANNGATINLQPPQP